MKDDSCKKIRSQRIDYSHYNQYFNTLMNDYESKIFLFNKTKRLSIVNEIKNKTGIGLE